MMPSFLFLGAGRLVSRLVAQSKEDLIAMLFFVDHHDDADAEVDDDVS